MSRTGVSPTIGGPHFTAPGSSQGDNDSLSDLHGLGATEKPKQKESSLDALLGIGIDIRISGTIDVYLGRSAPKPSSLQ
ncbi:hypothetical protein RQP46_003956 [Phenoliferia psychrophenolica]